MNTLATWIEDQLDGKVEPNSGLGAVVNHLPDENYRKEIAA
jgi:hypothetical protein